MANRAASLRSYAQVAIQNCGLALPLKYPEFSVNLQRNPPSCEVVDADKLPPHLKTTELLLRFSGSPGVFIDSVLSAVGAVEGVKLLEHSELVKVDKKAVLATLKDVQAANEAKPASEAKDRLLGAQMNPTSYRLTVK